MKFQIVYEEVKEDNVIVRKREVIDAKDGAAAREAILKKLNQRKAYALLKSISELRPDTAISS